MTTLEPFIGGACFVHIGDGKTLAAVPTEHDEGEKRLKLSADHGGLTTSL